MIRHAHRHKLDGGAADNGLSGEGWRQAERVAALYRSLHEGERARVISSPKRRCQETVLEIAEVAGTKLELDPLLDEGPRVRDRVTRFARAWRRSREPLTVVCSHGDVIPPLIEALTGGRAELAKGGWAAISLEDGRSPRLLWLLQEISEPRR